VDGTVIPAVSGVVEETGQQYKPFWITETGWDTWSVSEQRQADLYLNMLNTRDDKHYPDKIFFYEMIDSSEAGIPPWGILNRDLGEKPSYAAYRDYISGENTEADSSCFLEDLIKSELALGDGEALLRRIRGFRDRVLMSSQRGREIVSLYYSLENPLSRLVRFFPGLRRISAGLAWEIACRLVTDSAQVDLMAQNKIGFSSLQTD
jgi:hypothetical protein